MVDPVIKPYVSAGTFDLANYLTKAIQEKLGNATINIQDLIAWVNGFNEENKKVFLELSTTRPDFESIKQQMIAYLQKKDSWKDIIQAGGGETILEFVAAIGALGQSGIIIAGQETNTLTASLTSSIYTIMRNLGVHIRRGIPAFVDVTLQNNQLNNMVIPSLSQFNITGADYFNRSSIVFNPNDFTANVRLYQGTVNSQSIISNGAPYQRFELGNRDYKIANEDIYCYQVDGTEWERIEDGLWHYEGKDKVFYENTLPEGNVEFLLGNDIYGAIPPVNTLLTFIYVTTDGSAANSSRTGLSVSVTTVNEDVPDRIVRNTQQEEQDERYRIMNSVQGTTISPILGGDDLLDKEHYRAVGPYIYSARHGRNMNTKKQHYALGLEYPGIADILFLNQRDIAPYNRNLINVVHVVPLMRSGLEMQALEWENFIAYLKAKQIWRVDWVLRQPERVNLDIEANIFCSQDSDLTNVETYSEYRIRDLLKLGRGSLGRSVETTDITDALRVNFPGMNVDYIQLISPKISIIPNKTQYIYLNNLKLSVFHSTRNAGQYVDDPNSKTPLL